MSKPWYEQPIYCPHCQHKQEKKGPIEIKGVETAAYFRRILMFFCEMCGTYFKVWKIEPMNTEPEVMPEDYRAEN
jgi:hypothetical protein